MHYTDLFNIYISQPVQDVIGKTVRSVTYWVLNQDRGDYDIDNPNRSGGCQAIFLYLDNGMLEISMGGFRELRYENLTIDGHIQLYFGDSPSRLIPTEQLYEVPATNARQWKDAVNNRLKEVTIYGNMAVPVIARFAYVGGTTIVALGDSRMDPLAIGDGDELLVFSEPEWNAIHRQNSWIKPIWSWPELIDGGTHIYSQAQEGC